MKLFTVGVALMSGGVLALLYLWLFYTPHVGAGFMNGLPGAFMMLIAMAAIALGFILIVISIFMSANTNN